MVFYYVKHNFIVINNIPNLFKIICKGAINMDNTLMDTTIFIILTFSSHCITT